MAGLYVRYWAGMIWSVSTLSPRTNALPEMTCCIERPDGVGGEGSLRRNGRGVEDERRSAVPGPHLVDRGEDPAAAEQPPLQPPLAREVEEHDPDQDR